MKEPKRYCWGNGEGVFTAWELKGHSHQIADTGDYDGYYEITNGKISLLTKDDDDEALQPIVDALNDSGCEFYQDDWLEFENKMLKEEISRLKFRIDNAVGQSEQLVCPICSSENVDAEFNHYNFCRDCNHDWAK
jgi:hypothetical protein